MEMARVTGITKGPPRPSILNKVDITPEEVKVGSWGTEKNLDGLWPSKGPKYIKHISIIIWYQFPDGSGSRKKCLTEFP